MASPLPTLSTPPMPGPPAIPTSFEGVLAILGPMLANAMQNTMHRPETPEDRSSDRLARKFARACKALRQKDRQLRAALDLLHQAARPFGACPLCWGDRLDCPTCGGRGKPGHYDTDPVELVARLKPVLRRSNLALVPIVHTGQPDGGRAQ